MDILFIFGEERRSVIEGRCCAVTAGRVKPPPRARGAHCTRARALPHIAKCVTCKSSEGELRACSFCKSGIYHNTLACLAVERSPATSLMHKAFPWCCPKCFKKGKLALDKMLPGPSPTTRKRAR